MKKVYIAGPITGDPNYLEKFDMVEAALKALGLETVNPAHAPEGLTYRQYISRGLKQLMSSDIICCITTKPQYPNKRPVLWPSESKGERLEWLYARTVEMPILEAYLIKGKEGTEVHIECPQCWPGMFKEEE